MTSSIQIALERGQCAEVYAGEAGGFRLIVCRLKSLPDTRTIPPAEARRTTVKGETVARPRFQKPHVYYRNGKAFTRYREDVLDSDGTLRRIQRGVTLGEFEKKKDALRAAEALLRPLNSGAFQPQMMITLAEFWERYFLLEMLPTLKHSTQKMYISLGGKHLLPYFGKHKLHEIRRLQVQQFIVQKHQQGLSTQTVGHLRDLLSKVCETAKSWGWLQENSARGTKLPPMEAVRQSRVLSPDEITRMVGALREPARAIFFLGVCLGLRIGELLALRIEDVDLDGAMLWVRRDVYRGHIQSPKTKASERQFELSPLHVRWLRSYLSNRKVRSDWLFPSAAGTVLNDRNLMRREVEPVCKNLTIPRFGWHSLRHTHTTVQHNNRTPVAVTQAILGHTSLNTTMIYAHALTDAKREALAKVGEVLFSDVLNLGDAETKEKVLVQ